MTPDDLLAQHPYDPSKRGREESYTLPRKLECLEDETLRVLVAQAWLGSKAGRDWVELQRISEPGDHWSDT